MRELTQQEIDSAGFGFTHYSINEFDLPLFWVGGGYNRKPIPRKPFDIGEYEFDGLFYQGGSAYRADFNIDIESFSLHKADVIALAKHFKLI